MEGPPHAHGRALYQLPSGARGVVARADGRQRVGNSGLDLPAKGVERVDGRRCLSTPVHPIIDPCSDVPGPFWEDHGDIWSVYLEGVVMPTSLTVLLVIAGVIYVMWRRLRGEPLQAKRLVVLPAVFSALGIVDLTGPRVPHLSPEAIAFLVAGASVSLVLGAARGATIELFSQGGFLGQRYRLATVVLWGALIASKLVLALVAHVTGASGGTGLMLCLGLSLAGEAAVVAPRALSTGVPFAPAPNRSRPSRAQGPTRLVHRCGLTGDDIVRLGVGQWREHARPVPAGLVSPARRGERRRPVALAELA